MESNEMAAWNKGKCIGQMKPLTRDQVQVLKHLLEAERSHRDLALLSTGIDTMLRASDLLKLTVGDVIGVDGQMKSEISLHQQKTKQETHVALSLYTQGKLRQWITESGKSLHDFLFTGIRKSKSERITTRQYQRLVKKWVTSIRLNPDDYSTHSIRRTKASLIYEVTRNAEVVRELLGQKSIASTSHYLGIDRRKALDVARGVVV